MLRNATATRIFWDEDGCHLAVETDDGTFEFVLLAPEKLHEQAAVQIGGWLDDGESARRGERTIGAALVSAVTALAESYDPEPYEVRDPHHPRHHEVLADTATKEER